MNVTNVLEYWIDGNHYFGGDYYEYRRAPVLLHLEPGVHILNIRLVRDVRLFGAQNSVLSIQVEARLVEEPLLVDIQHCIFPETVKGKPAGSYLSLPVTNASESLLCVHEVETVGYRGEAIAIVRTARPRRRNPG